MAKKQVNTSSRLRKCAKGFDHLWEVVKKTSTHRIKRCERCKGHQFVALR